MKKILLSIVILFGSSSLFSQVGQIPLNQFLSQQTENTFSDSLMPAYSGVKPYQIGWLQHKPATAILTNSINKKPKWLYQHLFNYKDDQFQAWLDPILSINGGHATHSTQSTTYESVRGAQGGLNIKNKFWIGLSLTEHQARFPDFVNNFASQNGVLPGMGTYRPFKQTGYDYEISDAYMRWSPNTIFSTTIGYGKNFIGEGYRSFILSDNAFNYPFLQLNLNMKRFHYTALFNQYQNLFYTLGEAYQRKWSSLHYLTIKLGKRWHVGLMETIVWQAEDSSFQRGFDVAYLNPVAFLRPIEFSRNSPDNMMMGLHAKYRVIPQGYLYGQLVLDDFNLQLTRKQQQQHLNNKYAIQLGFKYYTKTATGLQYNLRTEYNHARPYMYGHRKPAQSYTHFGQSLTHPLNANFHEGIIQQMVQKNKWYIDHIFQYAVVGREDPSTPYPDGNNLFGGENNVPSFGSYTLQGIKQKQVTNSLTIGYMLQPAWNLSIEGSVFYKAVQTVAQPVNSTLWLKVGLVTKLRNTYWDF